MLCLVRDLKFYKPANLSPVPGRLPSIGFHSSQSANLGGAGWGDAVISRTQKDQRAYLRHPASRSGRLFGIFESPAACYILLARSGSELGESCTELGRSHSLFGRFYIGLDRSHTELGRSGNDLGRSCSGLGRSYKRPGRSCSALSHSCTGLSRSYTRPDAPRTGLTINPPQILWDGAPPPSNPNRPTQAAAECGRHRSTP